MGKEARMGGQIGYASNQNIPVVVIIGESEFKNNIAIIKDMVTKTQFEVPISDVVEGVLKILK
jgi:histidyl-tRNA synthetase